MGILAAIAIGGVVASTVMGSKAESANRKAAKQQRRLAQLQATRQRKELIREVQFAQAAALAANLNAGVGLGSSTIQGQQNSQRATLRDDLAFNDVGGDIASSIWSLTKRADNYRTMGNYASTLSQMASMASTFSGQRTPEFTNLPDPGTVPEGGITLPAYVEPPRRT